MSDDKGAIARKVDELGRIVLPIEARHALGIDARDTLNIVINGEAGEIVIRKRTPTCVFCGKQSDLTELNGKHICRQCFNLLSEAISQNS